MKNAIQEMMVVALMIPVVACVPLDLEYEEEMLDVASEAQPIVAEQGGGIAERVWFQHFDPEVTLRSYAQVDTGGCCGAMIGPNIMMSAAHCSGAPKTIRFRTYRTLTDTDTESFNCRYLTHGYPETDILLFWCDPNSAGENPGDKYGYMDFDIDLNPSGSMNVSSSYARLSTGKSIYKVWQNPITNLSISDAMLYSGGTISSLTDAGWYAPDVSGQPNYRCGSSSNQSLGVSSQIWSAPGASGSAAMSDDMHRILLGPQSTGVTDGWGSNQLSISHYLYWGFANQNVGTSSCSPTVRDTVNQPELTTRGLSSPTSYYGWLDKNLDGMFDVQRDIEAIEGEAGKDWLWLGFESHRRNKGWTENRPNDVEFDTSDPKTGFARLDGTGLGGSSYTTMMTHEGVELDASTYYDISVMSLISQATQTSPVRICLVGSFTTCQVIDPTTGSWRMSVRRFYAPSGARLRIDVRPQTHVTLTALSVVRTGSTMDFDSHDMRYNWRDDNNGLRGLIWPVGRRTSSQTSADQPDWAGVVKRNPSEPGSDDWSLRNRQMVIDGGRTYRVCFHHKKSVRDPLTGTVWGVVRLLGPSGEISGSRLYFTPGASWVQQCTNSFTTSSDDNNLQFGVYSYYSTDQGSYLVDDVTVEEL